MANYWFMIAMMLGKQTRSPLPVLLASTQALLSWHTQQIIGFLLFGLRSTGRPWLLDRQWIDLVARHRGQIQSPQVSEPFGVLVAQLLDQGVDDRVVLLQEALLLNGFVQLCDAGFDLQQLQQSGFIRLPPL